MKKLIYIVGLLFLIGCENKHTVALYKNGYTKDDVIALFKMKEEYYAMSNCKEVLKLIKDSDWRGHYHCEVVK